MPLPVWMESVAVASNEDLLALHALPDWVVHRDLQRHRVGGGLANPDLLLASK